MTGVVVAWLATPAGYGFISPDDGTDDVFVCSSHVRANGFSRGRDLAEGERVEFDIVAATRGRRHREARNVVRLAAGTPTTTTPGGVRKFEP